jgi:hypothetical protein
MALRSLQYTYGTLSFSLQICGFVHWGLGPTEICGFVVYEIAHLKNVQISIAE